MIDINVPVIAINGIGLARTWEKSLHKKSEKAVGLSLQMNRLYE